MMNKRARKSRISLAFAGITTGLLAIAFTLTPTAQATPDAAPRTVRVITTPQTTPAMRNALRTCARAPKDVRQACHSLYLRPPFGDIPNGRDIVRECYGAANQEARDYPGPRTWADYLRGCILGNIKTP